MEFPFTKMHGLGNDFVVFDFTEHAFDFSGSHAVWIADRHLGIGCDQILIVECASRPGFDFKYRIFNADGGEVGQCGNGARCFAAFVRDAGLTDSSELKVETLGGDLELTIDQASGLVTVNMGVPNFEPESIPLRMAQQQAAYRVEVDGQAVEFRALSIGNPHAVITVNDIDDGMLERFGPTLESHELFPERANIGFMQILDWRNIRLRVFERGVGETSACGSGACAAVVCGIQAGQLAHQVTAHLRGGDLTIDWAGAGHAVMMTGPTKTVFSGKIELSEIEV